MNSVIVACVASLCIVLASCAPSLVLVQDEAINPIRSSRSVSDYESDGSSVVTDPIIYEFNIHTNISNRFAQTLVTSKVKNADTKAKEAIFTVILPEKAFISGFVMEIGGKNYVAYVKEKEEAKNIYDKAVQSGQSAGHVAVSARDSNRFTVSLNIEAEGKATFRLTYEELLERRNDQYELTLNVHPGQIVKNMNIAVFINESRALKFVRTPFVRSGNEINKNNNVDLISNIQIINSKSSAVITFKPDVEYQKELTRGLGNKENEGLAGQFVLHYDVQRDPHRGEVLLKDGYFVHFFAPEDLEPLPKHVVFVLDTSGSMYGTKLAQLKDAMVSILDQLKESDTFHIVEFNTDVFVWNIDSETRITVELDNNKDHFDFEDLYKLDLPAAVSASKETIAKGKSVIQKLQDTDLTNMQSSLEVALHLVSVDLKKGIKHNQPMIIFLTDGDPTVGVTDTEEIIKTVTRINNEKDHVPIFCLSFGTGADKNSLRKLSLKNLGFSRHIYEASDASLQLQEFYKQISSPLLSNVHFEYTDVADVSKKFFPIYFDGSELVVSGKYDEGFDVSKLVIKCRSLGGPKEVKSISEEPVSSLERFWAYLTVKQKLEERETVENKTKLTKEALDLALKYSFVTDVSSLVVVKPNDTSEIDTEEASKPVYEQYRQQASLQVNRQYLMAPQSFMGKSNLHFLSVQPRPNSAYFEEEEGDMLMMNPLAHPMKSSTTIILPQSSWMSNLKWLTTELHTNGTLSILGGTYLLDDNTPIVPTENCPLTPLNVAQSGQCSILRMCPEVYSYLTNFNTYEKYACIVNNKYAGVCCPKKIIDLP